MKRILVLLILALALTACLCPPCPETPTPEPTATPMPAPDIEWDERLDDLRVGVNSGPGYRFRLVAAWITINGDRASAPEWAQKYYGDRPDSPSWATPGYWPECGGDHHVFGITIDEDGSVQTTKVHEMFWPDDGYDARRPEGSGWANLPLWPTSPAWSPSTMGPGPYSFAPKNGELLFGLGLPDNLHVSYHGVWEEIVPEQKLHFFQAIAKGVVS